MELKEKTLYINTIKRCKRLGAISEKEIIIQLAKEIEYYRNEISNLENELGKQQTAEQLEAISNQGITKNPDTVHLTVYPTGILDEEKEVKDVERCKKELKRRQE